MKLIIPLVIILVSGCNNRKTEPVTLPVIIYLVNFDSTSLPADIAFLKGFPFVTGVSYVSKEEAKKKYLGDGNKDWSAVLEENPLPDSYTVMVNADEFDEEDREDFKSKVLNQIKNSTDIEFPGLLLRNK